MASHSYRPHPSIVYGQLFSFYSEFYHQRSMIDSATNVGGSGRGNRASFYHGHLNEACADGIPLDDNHESYRTHVPHPKMLSNIIWDENRLARTHQISTSHGATGFSLVSPPRGNTGVSQSTQIGRESDSRYFHKPRFVPNSIPPAYWHRNMPTGMPMSFPPVADLSRRHLGPKVRVTNITITYTLKSALTNVHIAILNLLRKVTSTSTYETSILGMSTVSHP